MKLHVDPEVDALYLRLNESKIIESEEVSPGVVLDYDAKQEVVGGKILYLSQRGVDTNKLDFETLRTPTPATVLREEPPPYDKEHQGRANHQTPHRPRRHSSFYFSHQTSTFTDKQYPINQ
ncbi:MAG: DUF2283 domain-containing protein [Chthoniobacterales bacterium]